MRICITLDDVIRAKTKQFGKMMVKSFKISSESLSNMEITTNDLCEAFGFESRGEYNKFLYEDYPFEIFAEAPVMERMLDKNLNLWMLGILNEDGWEGTEFILANPYEFNTSIGFTCFFLSQIATRVREFYFPADSSKIWDRCDVLITANPSLLNGKPEGKTAIRIEKEYNKDCPCDYHYETLSLFLTDENIIEKLLENA